MTDNTFEAERLADQIMDLIHSRPRSPTRDEILTAIRDRVVQSEVRSARAVDVPGLSAIKVKAAQAIRHLAIARAEQIFRSAASGIMAQEGFLPLPDKYSCNQDALVLGFENPALGTDPVYVVMSGLEQMQNADAPLNIGMLAIQRAWTAIHAARRTPLTTYKRITPDQGAA